MARNTKKDFSVSLDGRKIPLLTLDHKWYKLFALRGMPGQIKDKAEQLNALLMQQGKCNTELKKLKVVKKSLVDEIVPLMAEAAEGNREAEQRMQKNKRMIDECNERIEALGKEIDGLPEQVSEVNNQLMLMTMEECYDMLQDNDSSIDQITEWINTVRVELKKKVVKKQECELLNHTLYSYMHDIFGAEVIEIFDMQYVPERMKTPDFKHGSMAE